MMFFKQGDVKGAIYEGALEKNKINNFVNEGLGRKVERTKVNKLYDSLKTDV